MPEPTSWKIRSQPAWLSASSCGARSLLAGGDAGVSLTKFGRPSFRGWGPIQDGKPLGVVERRRVELGTIRLISCVTIDQELVVDLLGECFVPALTGYVLESREQR